MDISEEADGQITIVIPRGRLDGTANTSLAECLQTLASKPEPRLLIDLAGVSFMASAGLRVIMTALKTVNAAGGMLVICSVQKPVREVFDVTGFTGLFQVFDERKTALGLLKAV